MWGINYRARVGGDQSDIKLGTPRSGHNEVVIWGKRPAYYFAFSSPPDVCVDKHTYILAGSWV